MQIQYVSFSTCPTQNHTLGSLLMRRRQQLRMTCTEASELSGVSFATWIAIEAGWVPALEEGTLFAIASTLELGTDVICRAASCWE
jgi:hypothetical protein